jgi:hypothetical protein
MCLRAAALKRFRLLLRHGKHGRATITVKAADKAGHTNTATERVRRSPCAALRVTSVDAFSEPMSGVSAVRGDSRARATARRAHIL